MKIIRKNNFLLLLYSLFIVSFIVSIKAHKIYDGFSLISDFWDKHAKIVVSNDDKKDSTCSIPCKKYQIFLTTSLGVKFQVNFFDRGSDTLVLLGQALPAPKESMNVFVNMFDDCDAIMFDYRWVDCYEKELIKSSLALNPVKHILFDCEEEVRAVLDWVKKIKQYKNIVGLGQCYSNFLFAKIQTDSVIKNGEGPFTHLIMDSSWHSLISFVESIFNDPYLPFSHRDGGAPSCITLISKFYYVKWFFIKLIFSFLSDVNIEDYLSKINIPVLFIHGDKDLFVPQEHFKKIWRSVPKNQRICLKTSYKHVDNLRNKALYKLICNIFIQNKSVKDFYSSCKNIIC